MASIAWLRQIGMALLGIFPASTALALDLKAPSAVKDNAERTESLPSYQPESEFLDSLRFREAVADSEEGLPAMVAQNEAELARLVDALSKKQSAQSYVELGVAFAKASAWRHDYILEVGPAAFAKQDQPGVAANLDPETEAREQLMRSANLLRKIFTDNSKKKALNLEEINLLVAEQLGRLGNENAEFYYRQFFRTYKNSTSMNRAMLSYGDFLTLRGQFDAALNTYRTVINDKKSVDYPYALLKYAWAAINAGYAKSADRNLQYKRAETALKVVVKHLQDQKGMQAEGLRDRSLESLALLWAEMGATKVAEDYLRAHQSTAYYPVFQERLADLYALNPQQQSQASQAYESLLKQFGGDTERVSRVSLKLVRLMPELNRGEDIIPTLTAIARSYTNLNMAEGYRYQRSHHFSFAEVFERTLHGVTNVMATKARAGDAAALALADKLYAYYLATVPTNENTDMVAFQQASLWLDTNRFKEAAEGFRHLVDQQTSQSPMLYEAAYKTVMALDRWDGQTTYDPLPELGKVREPIPLPELKATERDAIDLFVAMYPKDEATPQMMRMVAYQDLSYGDYDEAMQRFEDLAMQFPDQPQAKEALETILGLQVERGQWRDLAERTERYLGTPKLKNVGLRRKMREAMEYARQQFAH